MENREMHQLQRQYVQQTQSYLESLKQGASSAELEEKKRKLLELSRQLDHRHRNEHVDPSSNQKRKHH